jgi:serine/threonine-protein phosphatase 6 regulatory ankyrin repeat subunit B
MRKLTITLVAALFMLLASAVDAQDIFQLVSRGDVLAVNRLLARNPQLVRARENKRGLTPLHVAAAYGHLPVVQTLLKHGAEVNAKDHMGSTPLFYAVGRDQISVARELLSHGADVNIAVEHRVAGVSAGKVITPLVLAVRRANPQMVRLLIQHGARVRGSGSLAFFAAVNSGKVELVQMLLKAGADPLGREKTWGATPLHTAAGNGHLNVMDVLRTYYRSVDISDDFGRTPLHYAAMAGKLQAMEWLLQRGASVNAKDRTGMTPLMHAAGMGHASAVEMLLQRGADIRVKDRTGRTALHLACRLSGDKGVTVVQVLVRYGVDCNERDNFGMSPLKVALDRGNKKCAEVLRQHGVRE